MTNNDPIPTRPATRSQKKSNRRWWVGGFLFGFMVGLAMSLTYGWILDPRPLPVTPAELKPAHKDFYVRLIALAYGYDHDLVHAQARLATLQDANIMATIVRLTESYINQGGDIRDIIPLVELADALGELSPAMVVFLTTPTNTPTITSTPTETSTATPAPTLTHTPTVTPLPTSTEVTATSALTSEIFIITNTVQPEFTSTSTRTARPTRTSTPSRTPTVTPTATANPNVPFRIRQSRQLCESRNPGSLKIFVRDQHGEGIPGVEIIVRWANGEDRLFTGFKSPIDSGYADFQIETERAYTIELVALETTEAIPEIRIENETFCRNVIPSWQIVFQQGTQGTQ
ncbi:hypothetical protein QUF64_00010 [Anaerolineales bacterium HSG6]|nr:hypothetical protein [Anaerolineales bacterium HSG6]